MAVLGTKKFWKPAPGASATQRENQILKNAGYINLQLHSVNYMSKGNFWQNSFGGRDNIALATTLKYQKGVELIEATSVQDMRKVKANRNYNLGLQRNLAVKIPANADAISIEVQMTAVKNDALQAKFDMLNKSEYQAALELAPVIVGQVITITSLVKDLFTDSDPATQLEASYAGVISIQAEDNPVGIGKLTRGMLIMISTNDGDSFTGVDEKKFEIRGDALYYDNKEVENTYVIFNISFEALKGADENTSWFRKYSDALSNLDKIQLTEDRTEIEKIWQDSKTMWIEGNALIDADLSYISRERVQIRNAAMSSIKEKYRLLAPPALPAASITAAEVLKGLSGSSSFNTVKMALPQTGLFLNANFNKLDPAKPFDSSLLDRIASENELDELLHKDKTEYLNNLKKVNLSFNLA